MIKLINHNAPEYDGGGEYEVMEKVRPLYDNVYWMSHTLMISILGAFEPITSLFLMFTINIVHKWLYGVQKQSNSKLKDNV